LVWEVGHLFLDPTNSAEQSIEFGQRINIPTLRTKWREVANSKTIGETLEIMWEVPRCDQVFGITFHWRNVVYRKQSSGRWQADSGDVQNLPDLNDIVSTSVPDIELFKPFECGEGA